MSQHWILRDENAQFSGNAWNLNVALGRSPTRSIHGVGTASTGPQLHLRSRDKPELGIDLFVHPIQSSNQLASSPLLLSDVYVRGDDLVASYQQQSNWRFGYQMDIRFVDPMEHDAAGFEIWLSVQTSLLDAHPQLLIRIPKSDFEQLGPGLWTSSDNRFGLLVHPLDISDCTANQYESSLDILAFGRFMEKGVIRRMRLKWIANTHTRTVSEWKSEMEKFSESPLPLTT